MKRLACHGLLDNTVIMYTSDNGFKLGNHNMAQVGCGSTTRCVLYRVCSTEHPASLIHIQLTWIVIFQCSNQQEKFTYFEEDVRVPFLMAGPGVPRGVYVPEVAAAMTDLTATIAHLAGACVAPCLHGECRVVIPLLALCGAVSQPSSFPPSAEDGWPLT